MSLPTAHLRPLIDGVAFAAGLPWWRSWSPACWLEAQILQESAGNPLAVRYERHQDVASPADPDAPGEDNGPLEDDKSYGLMQVMGYNIRRIVGAPPGTALNFGFALRPIIGLALGLRILTEELEASEGSVPRALARYNGGPHGEVEVAPGRMYCQEYVKGVAAWADRVARDRAATR